MKGPSVDRRVTLQWLFGAMAAAGVPSRGLAQAVAGTSPAWPSGMAAPVTAPGYGQDPPLLEPKIPWPKIMTSAQLETAAAVCDTILPADGAHPAPSAVGVQQFVDEWVSAPYPQQSADRPVILAGLEWLGAEAKRRHNQAYPSLPESDRRALLLDAAADPRGNAFLQRMKFLTTGAYFTNEPGIAELGYVGNEALSGDYPGPTPEALAHLDKVLADLKLPPRKDRI